MGKERVKSMNIRDFLNEMLFYFPLKRSKDDFEKLFELYVDDILFALSEYPDYDCDYEKLLKYIRCNRVYTTFPPVAEIVKDISKALVPKPVKESYSGREGEVIKRVLNGVEYEFTIVPNHWDKVKTISQLDFEIRKKKKKEIA